MDVCFSYRSTLTKEHQKTGTILSSFLLFSVQLILSYTTITLPKHTLFFSLKFTASLQHIVSKLINIAEELPYQYSKPWFSEFPLKSCHHSSCRSTSDRWMPLKKKKATKDMPSLHAKHNPQLDILFFFFFFKLQDSLTYSLEQSSFQSWLRYESLNC